MTKLLSILTILLPLSILASSHENDEKNLEELEKVISSTEKQMRLIRRSIKEAKKLFTNFPELEHIKGKSVADVGSGFGHKSKAMMKKGAEVVCIEPSEDHLDIMSRTLNIHPISLLNMKVEGAPKPLWKTFDIVTFFDMPFHSINSDKEAFDFFAALYNILKDNGKFLATLKFTNKKTEAQFNTFRSHLFLFFPNSKQERRKISKKSSVEVISATRQPLNYYTIKFIQERLNIPTNETSFEPSDIPSIKFEIPLQISDNTIEKLRERMKSQIDDIASSFSFPKGTTNITFSFDPKLSTRTYDQGHNS